MELGELRKLVENEIDAYKYEIPQGSVGNAWSPAKVESHLQKMRESLVEPCWANIELRDTFEQAGQPKASVRACAVVAADGRGTLVAFGPVEEGFVLVQMGNDSLTTFGVRGDAAGCFMAI